MAVDAGGAATNLVQSPQINLAPTRRPTRMLPIEPEATSAQTGNMKRDSVQWKQWQRPTLQ